jgi:hypothetical protein
MRRTHRRYGLVSPCGSRSDRGLSRCDTFFQFDSLVYFSRSAFGLTSFCASLSPDGSLRACGYSHALIAFRCGLFRPRGFFSNRGVALQRLFCSAATVALLALGLWPIESLPAFLPVGVLFPSYSGPTSPRLSVAIETRFRLRSAAYCYRVFLPVRKRARICCRGGFRFSRMIGFLRSSLSGLWPRFQPLG